MFGFVLKTKTIIEIVNCIFLIMDFDLFWNCGGAAVEGEKSLSDFHGL